MNEYELLCYDEIGRRDKRFGGPFPSMTAAMEEGLRLRDDLAAIHSFRIVREIFNSAQPRRERWEPENSPILDKPAL